MLRNNQEDDQIIDESMNSMDVLEIILNKIPNGYYTVWLTFVFALANASDSIELMSVSYLLPTASCIMNMGPGQKGLLSSISFVGMMIGGTIGGYMADTFGRKPTLCLTMFINGLGGLASAFQSNSLPLMFFRFVAAIGVGGSIPVVWTYFAEFLPTNRRGLFLTLVSNSWMFGSIGSACLAKWLIPISSTAGWRYFSVASAIPALIAFGLIFFIPESPKYLLIRYGPYKCWKVVERIAYGNNCDNVMYKELFLKSKSIKHVKREYGMRQMLYSSEQDTIYTRNQLILLISIVTLLCYGYYGLFMWMPDILTLLETNTYKSSQLTLNNASQASQLTLNNTCNPNPQVYLNSILIAAASCPGNILSLVFIDSIGRKKLLIPCLLCSGCAVLFMSVIETRMIVLIFLCIFSALSVVPFNVINCIGIELFPTEFRSSAFSIQYIFGRIGAAFATLTFGYFQKLFTSLPLLIIAMNFIIAGVISFKLKETTGANIS